MTPRFAALAALCLAAAPAWADGHIAASTLEFCDRMADAQLLGMPSDSVDWAQELPQIAGQWSQIANGTGFTQGTNTDPFMIMAEPGGGFAIEANGMRAPLHAIDTLPEGNVLSVPDFLSGQIAFTLDTGGGTAQVDSTVAAELDLFGCQDITQSPTFWWTISMGGNSAWGIMTFLTPEYGFGMIANSAGGSRSTIFLR